MAIIIIINQNIIWRGIKIDKKIFNEMRKQLELWEIKHKVLGQEIIRSTSPGQMVVKIVYDELVKLLGEKGIRGS
jgi:signal recognition particle GTPase